MNSFITRSFLILSGASLFLAPLHLTAADDSKPVALSDTPPAVQKIITAQVADGTVGAIDRTTEGGETTFDVSFTAKTGEAHDFTVADDGTLLSVMVPLAATPPAVQKTIQAQAGDWQVESIDKNVGGGKPSFDVEVAKDGQEKAFTVGDDGTLASVEVALAETPDAVQKTIKTAAGDWTVESIDKSMDGAGTSFDVEASKGDQEKHFTVDGDGTLSSIGVALADTPAAVQKTIQAQAAGWQIESIDKSTDEEGTSFDIGLSKGGVEKSFTVSDDGYFQSMEVALADTPAPVQAAIRKQVVDGSLKSIEESIDPAGNSFDVEASAKDGSSKSFTIGADGALIGRGTTLDQTTPEARATIVEQLAGGTLKSIDENIEPTVTTYDVVAVMKDGSTKCFTVGSGGWMRSEEVSLDQTSPAARETIKAKIGDGKLIRIDKAWIEKKQYGVVPYEVQARKDGQPLNFCVGPKGKFLGADQ